MWITTALRDVYVVFAKVNGEKFTAFIVERTFPGSSRHEDTKWGFTAARQRRFSLKTAKCRRKTCCTKSGVGTCGVQHFNAGGSRWSIVVAGQNVLTTSSNMRRGASFSASSWRFWNDPEKLADDGHPDFRP